MMRSPLNTNLILRTPGFGGNVPRIIKSTLLCGILAATAVSALGADNSSQAQADYKRDRANCMNGHSTEDRATCLKEAGAAYQATKLGLLRADNPQWDQKNQMARCEALPANDRDSCQRLMQGEGVVSGSVAEGGIYRELTVREPAPQPNSMQNNSTQDNGSK